MGQSRAMWECVELQSAELQECYYVGVRTWPQLVCCALILELGVLISEDLGIEGDED